MMLVPIPRQGLADTSAVWGPFVESIAKRGRCHLQQRLNDVYTGLVQPVVVWDEVAKAAKALVGLMTMVRGDDQISRIVWLAGKDRHQWVGLNDELENYCRSLGSSGMEAIARPGWGPELKKLGYRLTHVQYEKDF